MGSAHGVSAPCAITGLPMAEETCERVEIPSFSCETAFIHVKIPAATTLGHRADSWGVDRPDVTCRLAALTKGDTFIVRLWLRDATTQSEETFAEAFWYPDSLMSSVRGLRGYDGLQHCPFESPSI